MKLTEAKRWRLVYLYEHNNLCFVRNKYGKLQELAKKEDIIISIFSLRKIIKKWTTTNTIVDKAHRQRKKVLISEYKLAVIDRAIYRNREFTSRAIKFKYRIASSIRSIQRYIRRLGEILI